MLDGSEEVDEVVDTEGFAGYRCRAAPARESTGGVWVPDVTGVETDLVSVRSCGVVLKAYVDTGA